MAPPRPRKLPAPNARRVVSDLRELAARTSNERGAQRVAWTATWREARAWFTEKVKADLGLPVKVDAAGNAWVTLEGESADSIILGSHLDSVPGGGWLDGVLGVVAGIEVLRRHAAGGKPPVTLHLVDWADEEGARYGRSLTGSAASAGTLDAQEELAHLVDRNGVKLPDALAENGVQLDRMHEAHAWLKGLSPRAYLELHIEQGPVLESMEKPVGVVLGTMGVERHTVKFRGQAVHAGATPIPLRRDAFLAAAEFALACRDIGTRFSGRTPRSRVVATCGVVKVEPGFVTAVPGATDISLDLRALDARVLARMQAAAEKAAAAAAKRNGCTVEWTPLLSIQPRPFDARLLRLCRDAVRDVSGDAPELPSGPLHDAAEMAALMPTVMVFAQSSPGISHTRFEDTPRRALELSIKAFLLLVERTVAQQQA
ncbi:MAG: hypothetical protein RL653_3362 [Pseudomonadota bacterium]